MTILMARIIVKRMSRPSVMKNLTRRKLSKTISVTPMITFQKANLATSIIFTIFHVYFNFAFLPPTLESRPLVPQEMSSILHMA